MNCFFCAVRDVVLGIGVEDSPVEKYSKELDVGYNSKLTNFDNTIKELETKVNKLSGERSKLIEFKKKMKAKDRRNAEKVNQRNITLWEKKIKKLKSKLSENDGVFADKIRELEKSQKKYEQWNDALGRPPYSENYKGVADTIRLSPGFEVDHNEPKNKKSEQPEEHRKSLREILGSGIKSVFNWVKNFIFAVLAVSMVPLDVIYTQPGFHILLRDSNLAYFGSFLYILLLVALGKALRVLYRFSINRKLIENPETDDTSKYIIKPLINYWYLSLFGIVVVISCAAIYGGVAIRSYVPEVSPIMQDVKGLEQQLIRLGNSQQSNTSERSVEEIRDKLLLAQEKIDSISGRLYPNLSSDAVIAFVLYTIIIVGALLQGLSKVDPIFEYHLATEKFIIDKEVVNRGKESIENQVDLLEIYIEKARLDNEINDESEEDIFDFDRDIVLIDEKVSQKELDISHLNNQKEAFIVEYKKEVSLKMLTYAKILSFLKRNWTPVKEWEEMEGMS